MPLSTLEIITKHPAGYHWGGNDHKTAPTYYGVRCSPEQYHHYQDAFNATVEAVALLADERVVELFYTRDDETRHVIAFRYRSDAAYNQHRDRIQSLACGLGFGAWEPFRQEHHWREWMGDDNA